MGSGGTPHASTGATGDGADDSTDGDGSGSAGSDRRTGLARAEQRARASIRANADPPYGLAKGHDDRGSGSGNSGGDAASARQFQYDAANTGIAGSSAPSAVAERWTTSLEPGVDGGLVVGDGDVYVAGGSALVALDAADGAQRWTADPGHTLDGRPAVGDDAVFVPTWNGADGHERGVVALDTSDGTELWRAIPDVGVSTALTVADGTVYAGGSINSEELVAVDATTGDVEWTFTAGQYATTPAVADGVAYVGGGSEHVAYALDAESGEELWRHETDDEVWGAPTVADGTVYVTSRDGTVAALSAASGEVAWSVSVGTDVGESVAVADDAVYVPAAEALVALSLDGERQWTTEFEDPHATTVAGDAVVVSDRWDLYCLDRGDGTERWSVAMSEYSEDGSSYVGTVTAPVVADGIVYAASHGGEILALESAD